jgi:hypothetical protein
MLDALAAISYLQSVAFKINTFILDGLHTIPKPQPLPLEPPLRFRDMKQERSALRAQVRVYTTDLVTADAYAECDFWVQLGADWRGRIKWFPHFNISRGDMVRSLFMSARGEPIGEDGTLGACGGASGRCAVGQLCQAKPPQLRAADCVG